MATPSLVPWYRSVRARIVGPIVLGVAGAHAMSGMPRPTWAPGWIAVSLSIVAVVACGLLGTRHLMGSINRLAFAVRALHSGQRGHRIGTYPSDELGHLARAFDSLAGKLDAAMKLLESADEARLAAEDALRQACADFERRADAQAEALRISNEELRKEIGARQRLELQLKHMSRLDGITALPNRPVFLSRLEHALAKARRTHESVALIAVTMDRFKSVNDSFGHDVGDRVLRGAAARLRALLRECDAVCRLSGDEFAVILEGAKSRQDAFIVAAKIVDAFRQPLAVPGGQQVHVTVSVGVAIAPEDGLQVAELMSRADQAVRRAKAEGRNGWRAHDSRLGESTSRRLAVEDALRHALARGELFLAYQPRVDARTRRIAGVEALLRWRSPTLGDVAPDCFIPVAEDCGLIGEIGRWALREAFGQAARWQRAGLQPGVVAVNISASQLAAGDFVDQVVGEAARAGLPPASVELELTESMLVQDPEGVALTLTTLRGHGFGVAIDDFGKGHSNLMHLKQFPASRLKIDRAFVTDIDCSADGAAIAASIVALGKALSINITAEGIEDERQLRVLDALGCDEYQGYLFARPVGPREVEALLQRGQPLGPQEQSAARAGENA